MTDPPCLYPSNVPEPRTALDNAITAGFRSAIGWCPFRDDREHPAGVPLPKETVLYDPIFGVTRSHRKDTL